ncbi:MAG: hypothetical protein WBD20_26680 [Pirellulaceae bacterium]
MKIQTIPRRLLNRHRYCLAICVATMMTVAVSGDAAAQGGLLNYLSGSSPAPSSRVSNASISNGGENFRVMNASTANVRTAADTNRSAVNRSGSVSTAAHQSSTAMRGTIGSAIQGQSSVQQVGYRSNCTSCGNNQCGGSCGNGYRAGSMGRYVSGGGWGCGSCDPYTFLRVEALYMERRGNDNFTLADDFGMDGFDYEWGTRITAGSVPDCVHGCEFTLVTPMQWDMTGSRVDPSAGINTLLVTRPPLAVNDLSSFYNATGQRQTYTADYWSLEANKTLVGWDVAKLLLGARYIDYDEDYGYTTRNNVGQTGLMKSSTDNQLFGAQIGMDLLYPVARFLYTDFRARAGAYLNFADSDMQIYNNGSTIVNNRDDDAQLAGVFELGTGLRYNLGQSLSVHGGTEMWYLTGLATAPDQFQSVVRPSLGRNIEVDDDIFFYGLKFGVELRY